MDNPALLETSFLLLQVVYMMCVSHDIC